MGCASGPCASTWWPRPGRQGRGARSPREHRERHRRQGLRNLLGNGGPNVLNGHRSGTVSGGDMLAGRGGPDVLNTQNVDLGTYSGSSKLDGGSGNDRIGPIWPRDRTTCGSGSDLLTE